MDYNKLVNSAKEWYSSFREKSLYNTHMFQYQAIGSAIGVSVGIFAEFFLPGSGKLVGIIFTPISFYTSRKIAFKEWHNEVKDDLRKGDYLHALHEAKKLYQSKVKMIESSKLSKERKNEELEKALNEYLQRESVLTKNFSNDNPLLNNSSNPHNQFPSPVQQLITDGKGEIVQLNPSSQKYLPENENYDSQP